MKRNKIFIVVALAVFLIECGPYFEIGVDPTKPGGPIEFKIEDIPHIKQENSTWCGPACIQMIAHWKNNLVTQSYIYETYTCATCDQMVTALHVLTSFGSAWHEQYWGIYEFILQSLETDISTDIADSSIPTIIPTKANQGDPVDHAILIRGVKFLTSNRATIDSFWVSDPLQIKPLWITKVKLDTTLNWYYQQHNAFHAVHLQNKNPNTSQYFLEFVKNNGNYYGGPTSYIPVNTAFLRVLYPMGQEELGLGDMTSIQWEHAEKSGNILIELLKGDAYLGTIASNVDINLGSISWRVGDYEGGTATLSNDYKIRVAMMDGSFDDTSNVDFSIVKEVRVLYPNGGEPIFHGDPCTISWSQLGLAGSQINIELLKDGQRSGFIAQNVPIENLTFNWTAGNYIGGTTKCGQFKIKLATTDGQYSDESDNTFPIGGRLGGQYFPKGGEYFQIGQDIVNIEWIQDSCINDPISFELMKDNEVVGIIASNLERSTLTYNWLAGVHQSGTAVPGNDYQIVFKNPISNTVEYVSQPFILSDKIAEISVPNGGENWILNQTFRIEWYYSYGMRGNVNLVLMKDGNSIGTIASQITILNEHENEFCRGSFTWNVGTIPGVTVTPGTGYKIKLQLVTRNPRTQRIIVTDIDESDMGFTISN